MVNTIDIALALFAAIVLHRVIYWVRIADLGFASETPVMFVRHRSTCEWIAIVLGIACSAVTTFAWYTDTSIGFAAMLIGALQANTKATATTRFQIDTALPPEHGSTFTSIGSRPSRAEPQQLESDSLP